MFHYKVDGVLGLPDLFEVEQIRMSIWKLSHLIDLFCELHNIGNWLFLSDFDGEFLFGFFVNGIKDGAQVTSSELAD